MQRGCSSVLKTFTSGVYINTHASRLQVERDVSQQNSVHLMDGWFIQPSWPWPCVYRALMAIHHGVLSCHLQPLAWLRSTQGCRPLLVWHRLNGEKGTAQKSISGSFTA
ncbi:hypothetical protein EYF80_006656 [Liparis tanakae]|uniref:Uncharacterized protein n=1 Tax=Liparis tanakae TaxID=230148 RepID=A0A4Z2IYJ3_9TELE|nr:hypothetical protein EYF80_006656 [Liparis tanakae]